ncbi:MAG: hypothetical protein AAGH38_01175 [Pseudomonadota bacterium]
MATTLKIIEGEPDQYPQVFTCSDPSVAGNEATQDLQTATAAWQRIESYIGHRWNERECTFIAEGPGDWTPPLQPYAASTVEVWDNSEWVATSPAPSPLGGYCLEAIGPYRFVGIAGSTETPPRAVKNAVFQLAEYMSVGDSVPPDQRVLRKFSTDKEEFEFGFFGKGLRTADREHHNPTWVARALQYSGAADLLRPYRNLGAN